MTRSTLRAVRTLVSRNTVSVFQCVLNFVFHCVLIEFWGVFQVCEGASKVPPLRPRSPSLLSRALRRRGVEGDRSRGGKGVAGVDREEGRQRERV